MCCGLGLGFAPVIVDPHLVYWTRPTTPPLRVGICISCTMAQRREWEDSGTESSELDEDAELRDWELGDGAGDEDDEADGASGEADEASDEADVDPSNEFFNVLLDEYLVNAMSANLFCQLCFWAHKMADMKLEKRAWIGSYGMRPGKSVGN